MNPDRVKSWATVAGMILLAVGATAGLRYAISPDTPASNRGRNPDALPRGVGIRIERSSFIGYDDQTRKSWSVRADTVDVSTDKSRMEARGNVEAELFDSSTAKRRALITAESVVFSRNSKTLQAGGKIICQAPGTNRASDLRVEADTLIWNVGAKQIMCPGEVVANLPDGAGTTRGRDLTVNLTNRELVLDKFHGTFVAREGKGENPPPFANPFKGLPF